MLEDVEVREIMCKVSSTEEITRFHEWIMERHLENQSTFDTCVISRDVEDVKVSYYNVMRMAGQIVISCKSQTFQRHLDDRPVSGLLDNC